MKSKGVLAITAIIGFFIVKEIVLPYFINITSDDVRKWLDRLGQQVPFLWGAHQQASGLEPDQGLAPHSPASPDTPPPAPTYIPAPTSLPHIQIMYIVARRRVRGRECARLTCPVKIWFDPGDSICVIGIQEGDFTENSARWLRVLLPDGAVVYVHSSLASLHP
jgi:hypothetical protein